MIIPVRCFGCGKPISQMWEKFKAENSKKDADTKKILDELGLERYCCRSMFMSHKDLVDVAAKFKKF